MRGSLDDLIRFLLEEIALCGEQGRCHALCFFLSTMLAGRKGHGGHCDIFIIDFVPCIIKKPCSSLAFHIFCVFESRQCERF